MILNRTCTLALALVALGATTFATTGCSAGLRTATTPAAPAAPMTATAELPTRHELATSALRANPVLAAHQGKVVVIASYATWCPAARKMLRAAARLASAHDAREVVVLGVSEDDDANATTAASFARGMGLAAPIMLDTNGALAAGLMLEKVPALVVLGRDGVVRQIHAGFHGDVTEEALDREVLALEMAPRPERGGDALASDSEAGRRRSSAALLSRQRRRRR
jgi:thiol-disulfide isomerase/thioredoxin